MQNRFFLAKTVLLVHHKSSKSENFGQILALRPAEFARGKYGYTGLHYQSYGALAELEASHVLTYHKAKGYVLQPSTYHDKGGLSTILLCLYTPLVYQSSAGTLSHSPKYAVESNINAQADDSSHTSLQPICHECLNGTKDQASEYVDSSPPAPIVLVDVRGLVNKHVKRRPDMQWLPQ